jgi:hypothetical protein
MAIQFWREDAGTPGILLKRTVSAEIHPTLMIRNPSKDIEFSSQVK